jgi:ADP-dependent NAD(P)H-hydrate dehydratase / NAD(P)H-hydrate epimerase
LPSGWPADETSATGELAPVFPADAVITFTAPKPAHVFGQLTRRWDQPIVVAPIGSPEEAIVSTLLHWAGSALALAQAPRAARPTRATSATCWWWAGRFGTGGRQGRRAGHDGAGGVAGRRGLVTAAVPAPALPLVAAVAPELMTWPLAATAGGQIAAKTLRPEQLAALMAGKTVLAIGPGMGQSAETVKFHHRPAFGHKIPAVIDADALEHSGRQAGAAGQAGQGAHAGADAASRRDGAAGGNHQWPRCRPTGWRWRASFAQRMGVTLVLKGARTLIAHPDGRVAVNTTGNPGMAKGGSGDLLTGLVAGLLAQYPATRRAPWRRRFICTDWPRTWPCARPMSTRCWPPTVFATFTGFSL